MEIQCLGAAQEVTGSCFLISVRRHRILIDCGLFQGNSQDEKRNYKPFPFNPESLDAVILTHAHLDHSGRIPQLVKQGFRGQIFAHRATRDICRLMFKDSAYLNEKDVQIENRKRERKGLPLMEPLYTEKEADRAMKFFKVLDYGVEADILPGIRLCLRDAGHILGSAILELWLTDAGETKKLVFSGDLGHAGAPILRDPERITEADLVIMESTYGDRNHRGWDATWQEMGEIFANARREKGNILIPSFALGRTQELLYIFNQHLDDWKLRDWKVFLDSPMAIGVTEAYARYSELYDEEALALQRENGSPFDFPNLTYSLTPEQSMGINQIRSGAIIIAGSGMCNGGRIKHHLKHNIWRKDVHVMIVGFQARGTLGRMLVDGAPHIRLWGETVRVEAKIHTIGGLSAHADQAGLINWYRHFKDCPPVMLIHGEDRPMTALAEKLRADCGTRVLTPASQERVSLHQMAMTTHP
jgi:metallo-beta-lactamase family protein